MNAAALNSVLRRFPDQLREDAIRRIKHAEECRFWTEIQLPERYDEAGVRWHPCDLMGRAPGCDGLEFLPDPPDPPEPQKAGADALP